MFVLQMEQWLRANQDSVTNYQVGLNAISSTRASIQWGTDNAQMVLRAARGSAAIVLPTTMVVFTALIALLFK